MHHTDISAKQWRAARAALQISQGSLGKIAGVSRGTIMALEAGDPSVLPQSRLALMTAFQDRGVTFEADVDSARVIFHHERLPALTDGS